jgi:hypothetical protein
MRKTEQTPLTAEWNTAKQILRIAFRSTVESRCILAVTTDSPLDKKPWKVVYLLAFDARPDTFNYTILKDKIDKSGKYLIQVQNNEAPSRQFLCSLQVDIQV